MSAQKGGTSLLRQYLHLQENNPAPSNTNSFNHAPMTMQWEFEGFSHNFIRDVIDGIRGVQLVGPIEIVGSKRRVTLSAPGLEILEQARKHLLGITGPPSPPPTRRPAVPLQIQERVVDVSPALPFFCDCPDVFALNVKRTLNVDATWQDAELGLLKISSVEQKFIDEAISYFCRLSEDPAANVETILPKQTVSVDVTDLKPLAEGRSSEDIIKLLYFELGCPITKSIQPEAGRVLYTCTSGNPHVLKLFQWRLENIIANPTKFLANVLERQRKKVHVFVDVSNIMTGAQNLGNGRRDHAIRVNVQPLVELVVSFRALHRGAAVGSLPETSPIWNHWRNQNFEVHAFQKDPNGPDEANEQGVTEVFEALAHGEVSQSFDPPHVLCLLTGGGNGNYEKGGLFADVVKEALLKGWQVVMWSWERSTARIYKRFQEAYPSRFSIQFLDNYRDMITFRERQRPQQLNGSSPSKHETSMATAVSIFQRFIQANFPHVGIMQERDLPQLYIQHPSIREFVETNGAERICTSGEARGVLRWDRRARTIFLAPQFTPDVGGGGFGVPPVTSQPPPPAPPRPLSQQTGQTHWSARRSGSAAPTRRTPSFVGQVDASPTGTLRPAGGTPSRSSQFAGTEGRSGSVGPSLPNSGRLRTESVPNWTNPSSPPSSQPSQQRERTPTSRPQRQPPNHSFSRY